MAKILPLVKSETRPVVVSKRAGKYLPIYALLPRVVPGMSLPIGCDTLEEAANMVTSLRVTFAKKGLPFRITKLDKKVWIYHKDESNGNDNDAVKTKS